MSWIDRGVALFLKGVPDRVGRHFLFILRSCPGVSERWGYHIRPAHFYEPIPDYRLLDMERLSARRDPRGVRIDLPAQLSYVDHLRHAYRAEIQELFENPGPCQVSFTNEYFSGLDAALYYSIARENKPATIVEIGAGYSTRIASSALKRNAVEGRGGKLVCIEPYPEERLTSIRLDVEIITQRIEDLDIDQFAELNAGDILFIDSSHTVRVGGDVCREVLDILPILKPGVWVHIHDIFFPFDYPTDWILSRRLAFAEQYLVQAFLAFNPAFEVVLANHWLCADHCDEANKLLPRELASSFDRGHSASSLWIKRVGQLRGV